MDFGFALSWRAVNVLVGPLQCESAEAEEVGKASRAFARRSGLKAELPGLRRDRAGKNVGLPLALLAEIPCEERARSQGCSRHRRQPIPPRSQGVKHLMGK